MTGRTTADHLIGLTANPYTPGRDPYTYACDFIRANPHIVPADVRDQITTNSTGAMSRDDASRIREAWAAAEGRNDEDLARTLADAYMRVNNIHKP